MDIWTAKKRKKIKKKIKLLKSMYRNRNKFVKAIYSVMYLWQQKENRS